MSRKNTHKISTEGGGGLEQNPFGALDVSGLPDTPTPTAGATSAGAGAAKSKRGGPPKTVNKGRVEVRREKAGRGGKTVTTLREFSTNIPLKALEAMTFDLKKTCACGGTLKGRTVELQGDVREAVIAELEKRGYRPVRAGG